MKKMDDNNKKYDFTANVPVNGQSKNRYFGLFVAIFWAFFLALALSSVLSPRFSNILSKLFSGISSLLVGMIFAFIFSRMVDFIERVILKNAFSSSTHKFAIKRTISIVAVFVVFFGLLSLFLSMMIPRIVAIIEQIANNGDGIYNNVVNEISKIIQRWFRTEVSQESIKDIFSQIFSDFIERVTALNNILELSKNVLTWVVNFLLGLLLAVLLLKDKEKISRFCRRFTYAHFKKERADEICVITNNANRILHSYVVCKLIEFALTFVVLGLLYTILGINLTWEVSLIIAVFNFIPYIGVFIGIAIALLIQLCLFENFITMLPTVAISTAVVCLIEFNLVTPFINSSKLKVNPIITMSATLIGGALWDIWGMLIAPPIAAIISVIIMGNIQLKENHMKYVMELNKARAQNMQDQKEQLGIMPFTEDLPKKSIEPPPREDEPNITSEVINKNEQPKTDSSLSEENTIKHNEVENKESFLETSQIKQEQNKPLKNENKAEKAPIKAKESEPKTSIKPKATKTSGTKNAKNTTKNASKQTNEPQ